MGFLEKLFTLSGIVGAFYLIIKSEFAHALILLFLVNIYIDMSRSKHD